MLHKCSLIEKLALDSVVLLDQRKVCSVRIKVPARLDCTSIT